MPSIFLLIVRVSAREMRHWTLMFDCQNHLTVMHVEDHHWAYLLATGILPRYLWASWPLYEVAIPIGDFEERNISRIISIIKAIPRSNNCQSWAIEVMTHLEASGLATFEVAAWAAMEALRQE